MDDVLSRVANNRPGFRTWFQRLPADAQAELEAARKAFNHDQHQKSAYAKAIIAVAQERGWSIAGRQGVIAWLEGKR